MSGIDNLRTPCTEVAREMQKKSVVKRAKNKLENRIISEAIKELMTDDDFIEIIKNMIERAKHSDKGFEILRDTLGQKPKESVDMTVQEPYKIIVETIR
ncbi:MAG: hypothetical protein IJI78_09590 [Oscillospiraceae bacterium]|nr:hypothetical protein [Oscillospiraceae bacterium]